MVRSKPLQHRAHLRRRIPPLAALAPGATGVGAMDAPGRVGILERNDGVARRQAKRKRAERQIGSVTQLFQHPSRPDETTRTGPPACCTLTTSARWGGVRFRFPENCLSALS